jgi:hypothetical protein
MFCNEVLPDEVCWLIINLATVVIWWAFARMLRRM